MRKLLLFLAAMIVIPTITAAPSCATYDCNMFLWYPLGFIAIMAYMVYTFFMLLGRFARVEVDLTDVVKASIGYISFTFFQYFCITYFDDAFMLAIMEYFQYPLGVTHLLLPLIALIFTWLKRRNVE